MKKSEAGMTEETSYRAIRRVSAGMSRQAGHYAVSFLRGYGIIVALLILVTIVTSANRSFLSDQNLFNLSSQWAPAGIMAIAQTFVILTGGFDLSIASGYSLCAVVAAGVGQHHNPGLAFLAAIGVGLLIGTLNGALITRANINPFIATVGVGFVLNGVSLVITGSFAYVVDRTDFGALGTGTFHGMPYAGIILVAFFVLSEFVLLKTVYGESIYAVGGNREASRLAGIRVRLVTTSTYVFSGFCMAIAGILTASQLSSAQTNMDPNILFDVITIVVVGGTLLTGGVGTIWRTAIGLGIIATISNGFVLMNLNPFYQDIVKGAIILAALALAGNTRRLAGQTT
jgi:ribose transport system permease protein